MYGKMGIKQHPATVWLATNILSTLTKGVESYIFVATTGRSGSASLAKILSAGERVKTEHEPWPVMLNIERVATQDTEKYFYDLFHKSKAINIMKSSIGCKHYVETNHLFIKNFSHLALDTFKHKAKVIHLYRDPISVALSFYRIDSIPGKTSRGKQYLIDPEADDNLLNILPFLKKYDSDADIYRCLWYWYETEARVKQLKSSYPDITFHKIGTLELNNLDSVVKMFSALKIETNTSALTSVIGTRENLKENYKTSHVDYDRAQHLNEKLVSYLENEFGRECWE